MAIADKRNAFIKSSLRVNMGSSHNIFGHLDNDPSSTNTPATDTIFSKIMLI